MGGLSRRELLKASAAAGGLVWVAPVLSTSAAWGQTAPCCTCEGTVIYAKFAPGNSQSCQNQCLQPQKFGVTARYSLECLASLGLVGLCDDVDSSARTASISFSGGVTPIKVAFQASGSCYVARCEDGFGKVYRWHPSTNDENYPLPPCDPAATGDAKKTPCLFDDPAPTDEQAAFQVFTGATGTVAQRCQGNQAGSDKPAGALCGSSNGRICPCAVPITGLYMSSLLLDDVLNFIELELCITNVSLITCPVKLCP